MVPWTNGSLNQQNVSLSYSVVAMATIANGEARGEPELNNELMRLGSTVRQWKGNGLESRRRFWVAESRKMSD